MEIIDAHTHVASTRYMPRPFLEGIVDNMLEQLRPFGSALQGRSIKFPADEGYWRGSPGSRQRPCVFFGRPMAREWSARNRFMAARHRNEKLSAALRSRMGQASSPKVTYSF